MESCLLRLKLSDDMFGSVDEAEELLLVESELNRECAKVGAGSVARVERGGGFAEVLIVGENADKIFEVLKECVVLENLPPQSTVQKHLEHEGQIQTVILFEA